MLPIKAPAQHGPYPDRHMQCQAALEFGFTELLYAAVSAGWDIDEAATALVEVADNQVLMLIENAKTDAKIQQVLRRGNQSEV